MRWVAGILALVLLATPLALAAQTQSPAVPDVAGRLLSLAFGAAC